MTEVRHEQRTSANSFAWPMPSMPPGNPLVPKGVSTSFTSAILGTSSSDSWVELIRYLDEQERKSSEPSAARERASLAEAELAVANQEKLLGELMRTNEPTEEATTLLKDLRRKVARAVAERN